MVAYFDSDIVIRGDAVSAMRKSILVYDNLFWHDNSDLLDNHYNHCDHFIECADEFDLSWQLKDKNLL